jgi:hypothetical protein
LLASSSFFFFSFSRRVRLFTGLTSGEVNIAASLELPSVDEPSAFLLAQLSDAFLHQQTRHSARPQQSKYKHELHQGSRN